MRTRSFTQVHDGQGDRYGPAFHRVRDLVCWLATQGYDGPGHPECGPGQQRWDPTACHIAHYDYEGIINGCGAAHDLYDGRGGESSVRHFRAWIEGRGEDLRTVGVAFYRAAIGAAGLPDGSIALAYVERARGME